MTHKQRMHAAYRGERPDRLPWLVNMDHWYNVNTSRGTIPARYRGWRLWDIQRELRVSIWQRCRVLQTTDVAEGVTRSQEQWEGGLRHRILTPLGELTEEYTVAPDFTRAHFRTKWMVSSPQELEAALYLLAGERYTVDNTSYRDNLAGVGEDGIVLSGAATDPLMFLLSGWMGVRSFSYALADYPEEIEQALEIITRKQLERAAVAAQSECPFFQVGGNITASVVSPRLFARYVMPFFREVTDLLHAAGKLAQYHFDGWVKPLLPMIAESGLDCIEALTPQPSGDVTLAEAIAALQGKLLIQGGMPAALVTHGFDQEECGRYALETIRIAKTGRVALGMGDNVPPDGDLERVRLITRLVEEQGWL